MIITIKKGTSRRDIDQLVRKLVAQGIRVHESAGVDYTILGLVGNTTQIDQRDIKALEWVEDVQRVSAPYKLASRNFQPQDTVVQVGNVAIGAGQPVVFMAGPCSVENEEMIGKLAEELSAQGAAILRGGAYKPRSSPYSFQGLGKTGIDYMTAAGHSHDMPVVTEIMDASRIDEYQDVDLIQVGARNMQNFDLLKQLGKSNKPILLKRGMSATIEEWLMSAEYILAAGNPNVILCERGIRTFERYTRNTLDLAVVPIIKSRSHLPIIIDPSHATGDRKLVEAVSLAAIAAGADGLIIEVHDDPPHALSDGAQSLYPDQFAELVKKGRQIENIVGR